MKQLNTLETFTSGFKIERGGKVFTLTSEEMSSFRYLDKAIKGRDCLEYHLGVVEEDKEIVEEMMNDEEICYNIEENFIECILQDTYALEHEIIEEYIKRFKSEEEENK